MDKLEAIETRHSVRSYLDKTIEPNLAERLLEEVEKANAESGLHMQLMLNEPVAFKSFLARYGMFKNVTNYLACVGSDDADLDEKCGYFGERIVLLAQQLGLNSCWVGLTYNKRKCPAEVGPGERLAIVIALGYGETQGKPHKVKPLEQLCTMDSSYEEMPHWFLAGMDAAQLAPTAINQQKFCIHLLPDNVVKLTTQKGPYSNVDKGIARLHFELGAVSVSRDWRWVQ